MGNLENVDVSISGSATFTNSDNRIALTGVGAIGLEIGDVITISGSVSNNGEYTVEHINGDGSGLVTDNNSIIVNYEHRGQTTTKALSNETATVTINLFGRAGLVESGVGQGWCNPASGRSLGVTYTNTTNRNIKCSVRVATGTAVVTVETAIGAWNAAGASTEFPAYFDVGSKEIYSINRKDGSWYERR